MKNYNKLWRYFLISYFFITFVSTAAAKWEKIPDSDWQLKESPEKKIQDAVIIFERGELIERDKDYLFEYYCRIKIFNEKGKSLATWEIGYDDKETKITRIEGRTIRGDKSEINLTEKDIFKETLFKAGKEKTYIKKVAFPGIENGSIIEFLYTKQSKYPIFKWIFQNKCFTLSSQYIFHPKDLLFDWRFFNPVDNYPEIEFLPNRKKMEKVIFTLQNILPFESEVMMPPENNFKTYLHIFPKRSSYRFFTMDSYSYSIYNVKLESLKEGLSTYLLNANQFWNDVSNELGEWFSELYKNSSELKKIVTKILPESASQTNKIRLLYDYVQQNFQNHTYLPEEKSKKDYKEPESIDEVIRNKYGTETEINMVYAGLLREIGIKATIIMADDKDEYLFDREKFNSNFERWFVVADTANQAFIFLNPGTPFLKYGQIPWYLQGVTGVIVDYAPDGKSLINKLFITIPEDKYASQNLSYIIAEINLLPDNSAIIAFENAYTGQNNWYRRMNFRDKKLDEIKKDYTKYYQEKWTSSTISDFQVLNLDSLQNNLIIKFQITIPGFSSTIGRRLMIKPHILDRLVSTFPQTSARKFPVMFDHKFKILTKIKVIAPEGYLMETLPNPVTVKNNAGSYLSQFTTAENIVNYEQIFEIGTPLINPMFYGNIAALSEVIEKEFNQEIMFVQNVTP